MRKILHAGCFGLALALSTHACALDEPWISDTYFYWYTWEYDKELGSWMGGVHNTPLSGYYDSRTFRDNRRSLWQASEWGITHHFMDYWAPTWKDEHGEMRERTVMRAAEALRREGYNIWMSYYQDGENFEMKDFSKNVSEKRDVHQWLRDFARSPVWPRVNGYPFQLVYGRNGRPKTTEDHAGFRQFLRSRYPTIDALNREWGTAFKSFDDVQMSFAVKGFQRALSIKYQYEIWQKEWARLDELVQKEFGLPGVRVSFDVAYKPFLGFGYSDFARVFGGPHSYGGIFGPPQDQDVERFIQAAVAKKYNTIFFDHFKNYYHDWDIRVPGTVYWPAPFNFDRFWVGALMRRSEALVHLSWNEWWEGSNLEPSQEFGKTYPQKNLFYSTIMQFCFPSIRQSTSDAGVVVLLNDWCFLAGGGKPDDLYETIQSLRRLNVRFDVLPDDFVTEESLKDAQVVIAPQCQTGLGFNAKGERIADVLWRWMGSGKGKRLIASRDSRMRELLGLKVAEQAPLPVKIKPTKKGAPSVGPDLNVFVDVGSEGDDEFIVEGVSNREDWGRLKKGQFGAGTNLTVRWTPGEGNTTAFRLPASPGRDHILRFAGNALWPNTVHVMVEGREAGSLRIEPGLKEYELPIPAKFIGDSSAVDLSLVYENLMVPKQVDTKRFPSESRVCNLAMDWLQFSTSNVPAKLRKQQFVRSKSEIEFVGEIFKDLRGRRLECASSRRDRLDVPPADVASRYAMGEIPRDVTRAVGGNSVMYINGLLSDVSHPTWWSSVLAGWAGVRFQPLVEPAPGGAPQTDVMSARLCAGDTDIVLVANYDISKRQRIVLSLPVRPTPLSEVVALSRDGKMDQPRIASVQNDRVRVPHSLRYYGVYEFAFSPVRLSTPAFLLRPGERCDFPVVVRNLTDKPVNGTMCARSVIPTLSGAPCKVSLGPSEEHEFPLSIEAKKESDWGVKTVAIELDFDGRKAYLFREVTVLAPPDLRVIPRIVPAGNALVEVENRQNRLITTGEAENVRLLVSPSLPLPIPAESIEIGKIPSGQRAKAELRIESRSPEKPIVENRLVRLDYKAGSPETNRIQCPLLVAHAPKEFERLPGALGAVTVFNGSDKFADHTLVRCNLKRMGISGKKISVRDAVGAEIPSQLNEAGEIIFPVLIPPRAGQAFVICEAGRGAEQAPHAVPRTAKPQTDLNIRAESLGTGKGRLVVSNSFFTVTLDEAKGGTVTEFRSAATGRDYGAEGFGVNYGTFGESDPAKPCSNTVTFIKESKTRQQSRPGKVTLVAKGPLVATATVEWEDRNISVTQTYEFSAYQSHFLLRQAARPAPTLQAQEIVALDARFKPNALCKTYPNFVGIAPKPNEASPHYGWRYGNWIPDYLTIMEQTGFQESISLIPVRCVGLDQVRQGFWPPERPKPGPKTFAEIEFIAHVVNPIELDVYVLLHPGYQVVAKQFREFVMENPLLVLPATSPKWRPSKIGQLPAPKADWFDVFWHYRVPVGDSSPSGLPLLQAKVNLQELVPGKAIDENSLRLVRHDDVSKTWQLLPFSFDKTDGVLSWRLPPAPLAKSVAHTFLYFDSESNGAKPPVAQKHMGQLAIKKGSRPRTPDEWAFENAQLLERGGPEGQYAVRLLCPAKAYYSLASNHAILALPRTRYRVSFLARAIKAPVTLHTNFYQGKDYDFAHGSASVPATEEWKRYETVIETRDFPESVHPVFRLWVTEKDKEVLLSGISVEPLDALGPSPVEVELGKVESLH